MIHCEEVNTVFFPPPFFLDTGIEAELFPPPFALEHKHTCLPAEEKKRKATVFFTKKKKEIRLIERHGIGTFNTASSPLSSL